MAKLEPAAERKPSLYVHVPFCRRRCGYCNFALLADRDYLVDRYLVALRREFELSETSGQVRTIFIGGGTPTHLNPEQLQRLFETIFEFCQLVPLGEFTVEANPNDIDDEKTELLKEHRVNRLSLGAQSFDSNKLQILEREHSPGQIAKCVELCRPHFRSISLDLMFGTRYETVESWERDLQQAIDLSIDHLSTYELTIEKGTRFWNRTKRHEQLTVNHDINARLYETTLEKLASNGFQQYEVSSFAQAGHRCVHNQTYWNGGHYFAVGPGAAAFDGKSRSVNHSSVAKYMRLLGEGKLPIESSEKLSKRQIAIDMLTFGLRQCEGCDLDRLAKISGYRLGELGIVAVGEFERQGLLEITPCSLKLSKRGWLFADLVCQQLLDESSKFG